MKSPDEQADVIIVGAGVMGVSLAWRLRRLRPDWRVLLIERDPLYQKASSSLSASSIRQQFTSPVNVDLSRFGIEFLRDAHRHLPCLGSPGALSLHEGGYLYLAQAHQLSSLQSAHRIQCQLGADVALLGPDALRQRFPWLNLDDIVGGSLGLSGEGWFDGPGLHRALLVQALQAGAVRIEGEVMGIEHEPASGPSMHGRVSGVHLDGGRFLSAAHIVNAAGPWSGRVAALANRAIDVVASRRTVFVLSCPDPLPKCPLIIDPSGFWLRPEGAKWLYGAPPIDHGDELPLDPDWRELDEGRWEVLARRIPALQAMRIERAWAGYYEMHRFDHNALIGPDPRLEGFWYLCGFSGHGIQHAPGAGLALAEWMAFGRPQTIDVTPLAPDRVLRGEPLIELNVIG